jgi:hypothetical protein
MPYAAIHIKALPTVRGAWPRAKYDMLLNSPWTCEVWVPLNDNVNQDINFVVSYKQRIDCILVREILTCSIGHGYGFAEIKLH